MTAITVATDIQWDKRGIKGPCSGKPDMYGSPHRVDGLLNTLVAYTATYRVEQDKWITKEVAWNRSEPNQRGFSRRTTID